MVFLMGDLDLPLRDRIYREPDGPHVVLCLGKLLEDALDHAAARPDCRALGVLGLPPYAPPEELRVLEGRRFLVADSDRARRRAYVEAGLRVGAEVEWMDQPRPPLERVAAWALPVGAVILAAGRGSRMGAQKLLLEVGGRPMVRHAVDAAAAGGCDEVVVVYSDPAVADAVADRARCVENPAPDAGQSSSLRLGLEALGDQEAGAVILLGDQPLVEASTITELLRHWRREGSRAAVATRYESDDGEGPSWRPPVLLDRSLFAELRTLTGDEGARQVLNQRRELVDVVVTATPPHDVDTPEDYAKIVRLFPGPGQG
ncbi:MAG TPA: nucleotidyltransferase family protein [Candidatus Limnocylindrales bacterium]